MKINHIALGLFIAFASSSFLKASELLEEKEEQISLQETPLIKEQSTQASDIKKLIDKGFEILNKETENIGSDILEKRCQRASKRYRSAQEKLSTFNGQEKQELKSELELLKKAINFYSTTNELEECEEEGLTTTGKGCCVIQ